MKSKPAHNVTEITDAHCKSANVEINRMQAFRPLLADYHREEAAIMKDRFDALVDAGFTEAQALEIVCR